ncbi:MAG: response regulator receiver [Gemmatimonadetes bacterium]|nr:response regulator receiver [Gemmatimonadota bacterium]
MDTLEANGTPIEQIVETLFGRVGMYDPAVVKALGALKRVSSLVESVVETKLIDVRLGMIFAFDVATENGMVLIGRGQEATGSIIRRIQNDWQYLRLPEPARVLAGVTR